MVTQAPATAFACSQLAPLARNTQAPAIAFACSQLATLARNTQAPAIAFACFQLATLARKKRLGPYLSASAFLGGFPPPNPPHSYPILLPRHHFGGVG